MKIEDEIKQQKFVNPHQKAVINLLFSSNLLVNQPQHYLKSFGITGQQFNVLRILKGQHPNSISAKEIKSRMLDKNSDMSRMLDRLIAKNLIVKKSCPKDKRASDVNITDAGLELLKKMHQQEVDRFLNLSDTEAEQLSTLLDKSRG